MKRTVKKMAVSAVAASMVLGVTAGNVLAHSSEHGKDKWMDKHEQKYEDKYEHKYERKFFKDQDDAPWALKSMIKMKGKKVFVGYEDGRFLPNKPITRAEAVVAAVRLMGLENEAKNRSDVELHFKDAREIDKKYAWAEGYIAVALENGLFDSNLDKFEPQKPATREWVATLLVRALGLEQEALSKMTIDLPFKDEREISAGAVGYVAVAVEKGLVAGYPDRTFRPNKPVTRAEMAALLDRMDWMDDDVVSGVKGQVYLVAPGSNEIVVKTKNGSFVTVKLDKDVYVFLDGKAASVDDIRPGYAVTVVFDEDGTPLLIDLKSDGKLDVGQFSGTIDEVNLPSANNNGSIEVDLGNEEKTFTLTSQTSVKTEGLTLDLTDLRENQEIELKVENGIVKEIKVKGTVKEEAGTLKKVDEPANGNPGSLTLETSSGEVTLTLAAKFSIVLDGKSVGLDDLQEGDYLKIKTFDGFVKEIVVDEKAVEGSYQGEVESFSLPTSSRNGSITIDVGPKDLTFALTSDTKVETDGLELHLSDLAVDQNVQLDVEDGVVEKIHIDGTVAEFEGEVAKIVLPTSSQAGFITLKDNNGERSYQLADVVTVVEDGNRVRLAAIQVGDEVKLKTFESKVKWVEIVD